MSYHIYKKIIQKKLEKNFFIKKILYNFAAWFIKHFANLTTKTQLNKKVNKN